LWRAFFIWLDSLWRAFFIWLDSLWRAFFTQLDSMWRAFYTWLDSLWRAFLSSGFIFVIATCLLVKGLMHGFKWLMALAESMAATADFEKIKLKLIYIMFGHEK
jgi:hypothetical protein